MKFRVVALPEIRKYFAELMQILYDNLSDVKTFLIRYVSNNHVIAQYLFDDK